MTNAVEGFIKKVVDTIGPEIEGLFSTTKTNLQEQSSMTLTYQNFLSAKEIIGVLETVKGYLDINKSNELETIQKSLLGLQKNILTQLPKSITKIHNQKDNYSLETFATLGAVFKVISILSAETPSSEKKMQDKFHKLFMSIVNLNKKILGK